MTATTDFTVIGSDSLAGSPVQKVYVECGATVDDTDTLTVDLSNFGGGTAPQLMGVHGFIQTTTGSVVVAEAPVTAVSTSTLTLTVGGSTDNKKRFYEIIFRATSSE